MLNFMEKLNVFEVNRVSQFTLPCDQYTAASCKETVKNISIAVIISLSIFLSNNNVFVIYYVTE